MKSDQRRQAIVFPAEAKILQQLGENIRLAMKRRRITQTTIAARTGLSKPTLRNIGRGEPTVSIGHYLRVLAVLGLAEDLAKVAADDNLGRKLQDIELLKTMHTKTVGTKNRAVSYSPSSLSGDNLYDSGSIRHAAEPGSSERIRSLITLAKSRSQKKIEGEGENPQAPSSETSANEEDL
ncbi:MAG: helix-turn-helix domain-containing protein [Enterobacteriaceae bacterium]